MWHKSTSQGHSLEGLLHRNFYQFRVTRPSPIFIHNQSCATQKLSLMRSMLLSTSFLVRTFCTPVLLIAVAIVFANWCWYTIIYSTMEAQVFPMGGQLSKENEFGMVGIVKAAMHPCFRHDGFCQEHDKGQQREVGQYVCSKGCNMTSWDSKCGFLHGRSRRTSLCYFVVEFCLPQNNMLHKIRRRKRQKAVLPKDKLPAADKLHTHPHHACAGTWRRGKVDAGMWLPLRLHLRGALQEQLSDISFYAKPKTKNGMRTKP